MDTLAEWLRRRPAKPMGSTRAGSNPAGVACFSSHHNSTWIKLPGSTGLEGLYSVGRQTQRSLAATVCIVSCRSCTQETCIRSEQ